MTNVPCENKPFLCVVGPTASGKSALAVHLAQLFDGEVISWRFHAALPRHGYRHGQGDCREKQKALHIIC